MKSPSFKKLAAFLATIGIIFSVHLLPTYAGTVEPTSGIEGSHGEPGTEEETGKEGGDTKPEKETLLDTVVINEVMPINNVTIEDGFGEQSDWIELYSANGHSLAGFSLSDGNNTWSLPSITMAPGEHLIIFASGKDDFDGQYYHTNFKISVGETITLTASDGDSHEIILPDYFRSDDSYGLMPDGATDNENRFFDADDSLPSNHNIGVTPGNSNDINDNYAGYTPDPVFSHQSGFYSPSINIQVEDNNNPSPPQDDLFIAQNGVIPDHTGFPNGSGSVSFTNIGSDSIFRAVALRDDYMESDVVSTTYLFNGRQHVLPVFMVTMTPDDFDHFIISNSPSEKEVDMDYFNKEQVYQFSQTLGLELHGGSSSTLPQRSFRFEAKTLYGEKYINYPLFSSLPFDQYKSVIFRNGGASPSSDNSDYGLTRIREELQHALINTYLDKEDQASVQAYEPVIFYINAQYYGVYNMRERLVPHTIANHQGTDSDNITIFKDGDLKGNPDHNYVEVIDDLGDFLPQDPDLLTYIEDHTNHENLMNYMIAAEYGNLGGFDWSWQYGQTLNNGFWQKQPHEKWHWHHYDMDGTFSESSVNDIDLSTITSSSGPPSVNASVFSYARQNDIFMKMYIQKLAAHLSFTYKVDRVLGKIDAFANVIRQEMYNDDDPDNDYYHIHHWKDFDPGVGGNIESGSEWENNLDALQAKIGESGNPTRNTAIYDKVVSSAATIDVTGTYEVEFDVQGLQPGIVSGVIYAEGVRVPGYPHPGKFFSSPSDTIGLRLEARTTSLDSQFSHWELDGINVSTDPFYTFSEDSGTPSTIVAVFDNSSGSDIVITEINYKSGDDFDPNDWVEIYNNTDDPINLGGWEFVKIEDGEEDSFTFNSTLGAGEFMILCRKDGDFSDEFSALVAANPELYVDVPVQTTCTDWGNFGLDDTDDVLEIRDNTGQVIDRVAYQSTAPWPTQPNGDGSTLHLTHPTFPNNFVGDIDGEEGDETYWMRSSRITHGSPGYIRMKGDSNLSDTVTTFDLVTTRKHILNTELLEGMALQNANSNSNNDVVTTFDTVITQKCILNTMPSSFLSLGLSNQQLNALCHHHNNGYH